MLFCVLNRVAVYRLQVAAAKLSSRYITTRFLPDKAIDLLDEAAAGVRVQLDSQPEAIDTLERRILSVEVCTFVCVRERECVVHACVCVCVPVSVAGLHVYATRGWYLLKNIRFFCLFLFPCGCGAYV